MASFSDRVRELRKSKNMTQRQMADALSITERSYQRYEADSNPNNETLLKLANFFNVSTDYLLGRSDVPDVISITLQARSLLADSSLSFEAKGMYMQFQLFAMGNKVMLPDEEKFLIENQVTRQEFDSIIEELESLGYIKTETASDEKIFRKIYVLT